MDNERNTKINDPLMKKFNDYLNEFENYLFGRKKDIEKAKEAMNNAIHLVNISSKKYKGYRNPKLRRFLGDGFLEAAKIADKANEPELTKKPLYATIKCVANLAPNSMNKLEYQNLMDYLQSKGERGDIQRLTFGVSYSNRQAEGIRFNSFSVNEEYRQRIKEKEAKGAEKERPEDIENAAQKLWNSVNK